MNFTQQYFLEKEPDYLKKELYQLVKSDESIFDFIHETSHDGLWCWDLENPENSWSNPNFWKLLGYNPEEQHRPSSWQEIILSDDQKKVIENIQINYKNPDFKDDQTVRFIRSNGNIAWIRCRSIAIQNEDGIPLRMVGTFKDVTQEIHTPAKWKQDHKMLLSELDRQSIFVFRTDSQGKFTYVNNYFCNQIGLNNAEVIGTSSVQHIIPQDRPKYREAIEKCILQKNVPHKVILRQCLPNQNYLTYEYVIQAFIDENLATEELLWIGHEIDKEEDGKLMLSITYQHLMNHLNNCPLGIVEYDKDLTVTKWSKKCEEIFEWTEDEILHNNITAFNLIFKEDLKATAAIADELMSGRVDGNTSYNRNYTKSGKISHCVWYNSAIKNDKGEVISVMSLVQDITQQKEYEKAIVESQQKLTNLISNLPGLVFGCKNDPNWTMEYLSDACKEMLGYEKHDLLGNNKLSFNDLIHPKDRKMVWEEIQKALKNKQQYELTYRIINNKGIEKWVWEKGVGIEDKKNTVRLEGFIQDITNLKEAKKEILVEKELSDNIINSLPGIFYILDDKGYFKRWNKNFEKISGYSGQEIKQMHAFDFFKKDEHRLIRKKIPDFFERKIDAVEANFLLKNQQWIPYYFTGISVIYNGEKCVMGVGIDITDRKKGEQSLKKLLHITTEQNKRLKDYSFITSHNIRSSVSTLMGLMQVISDNPFNKEYITMLRLTIEKLDRTIKNTNELLNFENLFNLDDRTACNISEAIHRVIELNKQIINEKNIEVNTRIPQHLTVQSIPAYLDSVFHNLISNAFKYGITSSSNRIEIYAKKEKNKISIYIKDYGLGLDLQKYKAKLFKLGSRFHASISDGQGMGLYMTKRQLEAMGGSIDMKSTINKGTTVKVCFND